jgi:hypothetical protein
MVIGAGNLQVKQPPYSVHHCLSTKYNIRADSLVKVQFGALPDRRSCKFFPALGFCSWNVWLHIHLSGDFYETSNRVARSRLFCVSQWLSGLNQYISEFWLWWKKPMLSSSEFYCISGVDSNFFTRSSRTVSQKRHYGISMQDYKLIFACSDSEP